jgi:transcriptional regulator with XRE-family HTH domain
VHVKRRRKATEWEIGMAERLKELREAAGLTQAQLAEAAGIPVGTLRGWELARRTPMLDAAAKVAVALGVSLDVIAGINPTRPRQRQRK